MAHVNWPSRELWAKARQKRAYVRSENYLDIETFTTADERQAWISRIEADKAADTQGYFTKEYNQLIDMVNGARRGYGFDVGLGDYVVRKELNDRLDAAHAAAAMKFANDPANKVLFDDDAWQDELRRRDDFVSWISNGEPVRTTVLPEFIAYPWGTWDAMVRARRGDSKASSSDLSEYAEEATRLSRDVCIDVFGCKDRDEWARAMTAAHEHAKLTAAVECKIKDYLKARGAVVTNTINETP